MSADTSTPRGRHRAAPAGGESVGRAAPTSTGRRPRHALRRLLVVLGVLGLTLALVVGGGLWFLTERYAGNMQRISDAFAGLDDESRPAPATPAATAGAEPVTFLLVGSDSRESGGSAVAAGGRSDAIILARISADRQHAQLISLPRDSWVDIPGHGRNKINAAYAFGGAPLLIQTVEQLTEVRIDHYATIDFEGIVEVTDDLGGVDVVVAETTSTRGHTFQAGVNRLDGDAARDYLRQRYELAGGDLDRVRRHQHFLQAVFSELLRTDLFGSPGRMDSALRTVTDAVAVDEGLGNGELLSLAYSLRDLRAEDVDSFTVPVLGTGNEGAASVVYLDTVAAERMWGYLRNDSLSQNAAEFAGDALPDAPR
jgi:LCP family protein required for cell wall assembly